ncbi:MAG: hypothetical protein ACO3WT_02005 [Candidatus Puniceispirillaceae bacterium]
MRYLLWPAIILPWTRRLLPASFVRAVVLIAIMTAYLITIITVGTIANCGLVSMSV